MTDRNGNRICETDAFTFDPPKRNGETDYYDGLRGRRVTIGRVHTGGMYLTVTLKSTDPVMDEYLREGRKTHIGMAFPTDYLTLID